MERPLTPLEFARRTRTLYSHHEAVVDEALRLTCAEFLDRCDRWSLALQSLGVTRGDRVACIAPNTHAQLESFYAVPQIGAVLVPINYRLAAEEFAYIINDSGAKVVCTHESYLDAVDRIRPDLQNVAHFVALEGTRAAPGGAGAARGRAGMPEGYTNPYATPTFEFKPNDWNDVEVEVDANLLRGWLNGRPEAGAANGAADEELGRYGPIALYVGGAGDVRFKDVALKDLGRRVLPPEQVSPASRC